MPVRHLLKNDCKELAYMCQLGDEVKVRRILKNRPVIAYRWCFIDQAGLKSVAMHSYVWNKGIAHAGEEPAMNNNDGLHAYKTKRQALNDPPFYNNPRVLMRVKLWGRTVEHEDGYRCKSGQIVAIAPGYNKDLFQSLQKEFRSLKKVKITSLKNL